MSPFGIRDEQRVAGFIDGLGLYLATRESGWDVDYKKLHSHFDSQAMLYRMFFFTTLPDDQDEHSSVIPLVDWLSYNEYRTITKITRTSIDDEGRKRVKRSMLCEMVVEMLETVPFAEHFVLFSGDADLCYAVECVQRRGIRVTVIFPKSSTAVELRRAADRFIDLGDPAVREIMSSHKIPVNRTAPLPAATPRDTTLSLRTVGTR